MVWKGLLNPLGQCGQKHLKIPVRISLLCTIQTLDPSNTQPKMVVLRQLAAKIRHFPNKTHRRSDVSLKILLKTSTLAENNFETKHRLDK